MRVVVLNRSVGKLATFLAGIALSIAQMPGGPIIAGSAILVGALVSTVNDSEARSRVGGARHVSVNRGVNRNINRNVNVNVNVNVNRNINRHVNVNADWDRYHYHPVARGVAAGVTAAAIGSVIYSLPGGCRTVVSNGIAYRECDGIWYAPRYQGSQVIYVVVNEP